MFCPKCGAANPDDARFCASCATPLVPAAQPAAQAAPPAAPPATPPREQWTGEPAYQAPPSQPMDWGKVFFIPRLIEYISQGSLFRRIVAGFLNVSAVLIGLAMLVFGVLLALQYFDYGGIAILGGLLAFPIAIFGGYMMVHTYLVRARTVKNLPASDYTVIPIMSILLKLTGEIGLITGMVFGLQGMLLAWFLGQNPLGGLTPYSYGGYGMYGGSSPAEGFFLGIVFFVAFVIYGFVILLVNYLLSELVGIFADIARDVRAMRAGKADAS